MVIKVDIDGVLRDLVSGICDVYNSTFDQDVKPTDITDYSINKFFPLVKEKFNMLPTDFFFVNKGEEVFKNKALPFDKVKKDMQRLIDEGHEVVICSWQFTHRNRVATLEWLENWKIPFSDICFTKNKWLIGSDVIIDDNPAFLSDPMENGHKIIVTQPYNTDYDEEGVIRVNSFTEAVDIILSNYLVYLETEKE